MGASLRETRHREHCIKKTTKNWKTEKNVISCRVLVFLRRQEEGNWVFPLSKSSTLIQPDAVLSQVTPNKKMRR